MKTVIITFLLLMFLHNSNYAASIDKYEQAKQLFVKAEVAAIEQRKSISKKIDFLDEIVVGKNFMKLLQKKSPELFKNASKYKWELLKMTYDKSFYHDFYTNFDIICILYSLSIDEYLEIVDSSFVMMKKNIICTDVFGSIIIQNYDLTTVLAKNYKYQPLILMMTHIKEEMQMRKENNAFNQGIVQEIDDILSGHSWYYIPDRIKQR